MKNWIKKEISKDEVLNLSKKFNIDTLTASIFARRNITNGNELLFYLENDLRFVHNPFLFNQMEDAVDRIIDAIEEGEKVLIFGDRDVDGITSTTILYKFLKSLGLDVTYKVPVEDETYGITNEIIKNFYDNYGSLIITVDTGIASYKEVAYAKELGIDFIITDHHNIQENIPQDTIIINPKLLDSGYPFSEISGCAVAYKLINALRFSQTDIYKQDICLLNATEDENGFYSIECVKLRNNVEKSRIAINNIDTQLRISDTKLETFLKGQQIFTWDDAKVKSILKNIFGSSIEFNTFDLRNLVSKKLPNFTNLSLEQLKEKSKIAHYKESDSTLIDAFINIFVTYINLITQPQNPENIKIINSEIQLTALACIADVMPLINENRILVNTAIKQINSGNIANGLIELLSKLNLLNKKITATDLSWTLIPAINATGRLGQPKLAIEILLEEDQLKRDKLAQTIIDLNNERKNLVANAVDYIGFKANYSFEKNKNLCVVFDEKLHRGVLGLISARLSNQYRVPVITMTMVDDDTVIGSMRSLRDFSCTNFLAQFESLFTNFGGHDMAAGFSLKKENINNLISQFENASSSITLSSDTQDNLVIDAELPENYINPEIFKVIDLFEPYGQENKTLTFYTKNLKINSYQIVGKTEKQHLKLTLESKTNKFPAMYWNAAEKINNEFNVTDMVEIVYTIERNIFNGMENMQIIILDLRREN